MALYKLKPAMKSAIWGGKKLMEEFGKEFDGDNLAETWELSAHPDGESVVDSGEYAGMPLSRLIQNRGRHILGKNGSRFEDFPILIKLIDANDNLSVQVHPDDAYAREHEGQYGKTEMWYVVEAEPGARLCFGCKATVSKEAFRQSASEGRLDEILNYVPVKKGDVFFIEAGTIHAIGAGIVIAEIQQNSNVTYRVYDYGRVGADGRPRELHLDKALDVAKLAPPQENYNFGSHIGKCDCFETDLLEVADSPVAGVCDESSFVSLLVVQGTGQVRNNSDTFPAKKGDCFFIEAGSGDYELLGNMTVISVRIPEEMVGKSR